LHHICQYSPVNDHSQYPRYIIVRMVTRRAEWELGLLLDRRPELRDVLEAAVDVLDEEALESVLDYVRFQVARAERKSKS
jgi:hypothetical protein